MSTPVSTFRYAFREGEEAVALGGSRHILGLCKVVSVPDSSVQARGARSTGLPCALSPALNAP